MIKKYMHIGVILLHCYFVVVYAITEKDLVAHVKSGDHVITLFTHQDNLKRCLLYLIQNEQKTIQIAAYNLTSTEVVQQLLEARKRKVSIEIVTGLDGIRCHGEQVTKLSKAGIKTYVISSGSVLMHNKYIIFGQNVFSKPLVWTGSANITERGLTKNYENVTVLTEPRIAQSYRVNFNSLKDVAKKSPSTLRLLCGNSKAALILFLAQGMISSIK